MRKSSIYKVFGHGTESFKSVLYYIRNFVTSDFFEITKERYYEKKLNIQTSEPCDFKDNFSLYKDGHGYHPIRYSTLEKMVTYLKPESEDIFIDFGCGKGRAVFFAALRKLRKIIGVELNKEMIDISRRNFNNFKLGKTPIEFIQADAANYEIKDETIFFMFNPFGPKTLLKVINSIKNSLLVNPRQIRIVYYSPEHRALFYEQNFLILEREENDYLIWRNKF